MKKIITKTLLLLINKLNKVESLNSMYEKLSTLASKYNEDYYTLKIEKNTLKGITIHAYINTFNWVEGQTIDECIIKLEKNKTETKEHEKIKEVLI